MSTHVTDSKTKFFHAMVLMGGSVALGCGGLAEKPTHDNTVGAGGTAESGGTGGSGGSVGSGGFVSSGGSAIGSGGLVVGSGGIGTGGFKDDVIEPGPFDCSSTQLQCENISCNGVGFSVPDDCSCNDAGPVSAADCQPDEWLVCHRGTRNEQGQYFSHSIPFNCQCLPAESDCGLACDKLGVPGSECWNEDNTILCGCAVVILR